MKRFVPFLVALPSLFFSAPAFAQCRNGWCHSGCNANGDCQYLKVLSRNYPYVWFLVNGPNGMFKKQADCQQYRFRMLETNGSPAPDTRWKPAMPGTLGEKMISDACNM